MGKRKGRKGRRNKGAGSLSRSLGQKTAAGNQKRRKSVKLDTKKLHEFGNIFGKKGITFSLGLFNAKAARKGFLLEEGDGKKQPARPWLSSTLTAGTTRSQLLALLPELVRNAMKGKNSKKQTADKMLKVLQMHLLNQSFTAPALSQNTIDRKTEKGVADPRLIGIDSFHLATNLQVRATGGKTERKKK